MRSTARRGGALPGRARDRRGQQGAPQGALRVVWRATHPGLFSRVRRRIELRVSHGESPVGSPIIRYIAGNGFARTARSTLIVSRTNERHVSKRVKTSSSCRARTSANNATVETFNCSRNALRRLLLDMAENRAKRMWTDTRLMLSIRLVATCIMDSFRVVIVFILSM